MSLPGKNEKGYLEIVPAASGFSITAEKKHAGDLTPLFAQHGIACRRVEDTEPGKDTLFFEAADRDKVQALLEGYEGAKGS